MKRLIAVLGIGAMAFAAACADTPTEIAQVPGEAAFSTGATFGSPQPTYPRSFRGIMPSEHPGNFVASDDDEVCYELGRLQNPQVLPESEWRGYKIDPAANFSNAYVDFKVSADKRHLAWKTTNATLLWVIVKGGPNFHLYDYVVPPFAHDDDSWLASPLNSAGRIPQVSHYNVCYEPEMPGDGDQGCTPGFWRNNTPANAPAWAYLLAEYGITPSSLFLDTGMTFAQALSAGGGGYNALLRHGAGAYLNSLMGDYVNFPYTTAQVVAIFNGTGDYAGLTIEQRKDLLQAANELGCPLSATNP